MGIAMNSNLVFNIAYGIHMLGILALLHGFFIQMSKENKGIHVTMIYGAITQLVTGIVMSAAKSGSDQPVNSTWLAVKFLVAAIILVVALLGKKATGDTKKYWLIVGVLTGFNLLFAFAVDLFK